MPEPRKRPARVRIDAIINSIKKGDYDDKLGDIKEAVALRYAEKRQELQERVLEVYGPDYEITEKPSPNPFISKAQRGGELAPDPQSDGVKARAAAVASELPQPGGDQSALGPFDPFGDGNVADDAPRPVEPQAVEIVSAPDRGASPAFDNAGGSSPPQAVELADDDDGYESRSPIITGGPPQ
jgi:hypothetical protein